MQEYKNSYFFKNLCCSLQTNTEVIKAEPQCQRVPVATRTDTHERQWRKLLIPHGGCPMACVLFLSTGIYPRLSGWPQLLVGAVVLPWWPRCWFDVSGSKWFLKKQLFLYSCNFFYCGVLLPCIYTPLRKKKNLYFNTCWLLLSQDTTQIVDRRCNTCLVHMWCKHV